jgi:hypothetical protein
MKTTRMGTRDWPGRGARGDRSRQGRVLRWRATQYKVPKTKRQTLVALCLLVRARAYAKRLLSFHSAMRVK